MYFVGVILIGVTWCIYLKEIVTYLLFLNQTHPVTTHQKRLQETLPISCHKIGLRLRINEDTPLDEIVLMVTLT